MRLPINNYNANPTFLYLTRIGIVGTNKKTNFNSMKSSTKLNFKKALCLIALYLGLSVASNAQCHSNYTYTTGSSGMVNFTNTSTGSNGLYSKWYFGDGTTSNVSSPAHTYQYNGTYNVGLSIWDTVNYCFDSLTQSITITNGTACNTQVSFTYTLGNNGQASFTNTSTNIPPGAQYLWTFDINSSSTQISPTYTFGYAGTFNVTLQIKDSTGICSKSTTQQITIAGPPPCNTHAAFTYTAGSAGLINFTNTSTSNNVFAGKWVFGDGYVSYANSPSHTYQYNGTYNASLSVWDSVNNCFDSTSQAITITNGLTCNTMVSFTYTLGSNGHVDFTNTSTNMPPGAQYYWNFGGYQSNQSSPSYNYYYNGTYNVYLQITDSTGYCTKSTSQAVNITNGHTCSLNAAFTYTLGSSGQVAFTNTSTGLDSMTHYVWTYNDGTQSTNFNDPHIYQYNGTYNVTLYINDTMANCSSSVTQTISITNTANAPACQAVIADSLFSNGSALFISYSTGTTANTTFSWNFGDGSTSTIENPNHTYAYNGTYAVTLQISDVTTGCSSTVGDSVVITNALNGSCMAQFTYSTGNNGLVYFTNTSVGGDSLPSHQTWDFGVGSGTVHAYSPSYTYTANGTYVVSLQITNSAQSCSSTYTAAVTVSNVGVTPCTPSVTFVMHQDSVNPQPGVWQVSSYYSPQVTSAVWFWGDGTSTAGFAPTHNYAAAGHYTICVKVYSSCGDSATTCQNDSLFRMAYNSTNGANNMISVTVLNVNATDVKAIVKESAQVVVYPNPSVGVFILSINNITEEKAQISISNILGDVVYNMQEEVNNNTITKEIDLQNLANGAYFMKVMVGQKTYTNKVIINK